LFKKPLEAAVNQPKSSKNNLLKINVFF